jgi:hypothetical protein
MFRAMRPAVVHLGRDVRAWRLRVHGKIKPIAASGIEPPPNGKLSFRDARQVRPAGSGGGRDFKSRPAKGTVYLRGTHREVSTATDEALSVRPRDYCWSMRRIRAAMVWSKVACIPAQRCLDPTDILPMR